MKYGHPFIRGFIFLQYRKGIIAGTIVNKDELNVSVRLVHDTIETLPQIRNCVVHRNDDGYF